MKNGDKRLQPQEHPLALNFFPYPPTQEKKSLIPSKTIYSQKNYSLKLILYI
jgi:hypothetical protein